MCRFFTLKHGSRIFFESGTSGKRLPWSYDEALFERWRDGKTGMPLVDANMREIKQTGESPLQLQQGHSMHSHQTLSCWCMSGHAVPAELLELHCPGAEQTAVH